MNEPQLLQITSVLNAIPFGGANLLDLVSWLMLMLSCFHVLSTFG